MEFNNIGELFTASLNTTLASVAFFVPRFITGLIVLLIGLIIASFVKQGLLRFFKVVYVEQMLEKYGIPGKHADAGVSWSVQLSQCLGM